MSEQEPSSAPPPRRDGWRRILDTVAVAFVVWLTVNPLVTLLAPSLSPGVQAAMVAHRHVGGAFLAFIILYQPLHYIGAHDMGMPALWGLLKRLRVAVVVIVGYLLAATLGQWTIRNPAYLVVVAVFGYALWRKEAPIRRRLLEVLLGAVAVAVDAYDPAVGRPLMLILIAYSVWQIGVLLVRMVSPKPGRADLSGHVLSFTTVFMVLCAFVISNATGALGPRQGVYQRHILHIGSAVLFLAVMVWHFLQVSRRERRKQHPRPLLRPRVLALVLALLAVSEVVHVWVLTRFTTPLVDATHLRPLRPTPYANLQGYRRAGLDAGYAPSAQSCGGTLYCHNDLSEQHDISAHGRAFSDVKFQKQLKIFVAEKGRPAADYCLACHAPLGVLAFPGNATSDQVVDPFTTREPSFTYGVGCVVCHRATPVADAAKANNASLTIRPLWLDPERYLGENEETPEARSVHRDTMLTAAIQLHVREYRIDHTKVNALCAACHTVELPASLADDGVARRVADQYGSFASSAYAKAGLTCIDCHQQRMNTPNSVASTAHNYLGSGTALPYANAKDDQRVRASSLAFLRGLGDIALEANSPAQLPPCINDIARLRVDGSRADGLPLRTQDHALDGRRGLRGERAILQVDVNLLKAKDRELTLRIRTTNSCDGHAFPSGGGIKGYLEVEVADGQGRRLGTFGGLGADGRPVDRPTNLGSRAADQQGQLLTDRRFWRAHELRFKRVIAPGQSQSDDIAIPLSEAYRPGAPYAVTARWQYLRPELLRDLEEGATRNLQPVVIGSWHGDPGPPKQ